MSGLQRTYIPRNKEFGDLIKKLRTDQKLSLAKTAREFCSRQAIFMIENGKAGASEAMVAHLSMVLGVSISSLVEPFLGPLLPLVDRSIESSLTIKISKQVLAGKVETTLWLVRYGQGSFDKKWQTASRDSLEIFLEVTRDFCSLFNIPIVEV